MLGVRSRREKKTAPRLEFTPLIDCAFILIIFFAVSTTLITSRSGMKINLPKAATVEKIPEHAQISIAEDLSVHFEDMLVTEEALAVMVKSRLQDNPDISFVIGAEKSVPYDLLVRVLDVVRQSGGTKLALQAEKTYEENEKPK